MALPQGPGTSFPHHVPLLTDTHSQAVSSFLAALGMTTGMKASNMSGCHQPCCTLVAPRQSARWRILGSTLAWGEHPQMTLLSPLFGDHWGMQWGLVSAAPAKCPSQMDILAAPNPCLMQAEGKDTSAGTSRRGRSLWLFWGAWGKRGHHLGPNPPCAKSSSRKHQPVCGHTGPPHNACY